MLGFRVWDSKNALMCYSKGNHELGNWAFAIQISGKLINTNDPNGGTIPTEHLVPLQSTGITDWHDRPIFVGDMLFLYYTESSKKINGYYLVSNVIDFLMMYGSDRWAIKKISCDGNIYECPALLERLK